ncbi:MAG: alpha/beta fold hydrolase [Dehalococcoidia bacterium]|nr:alpha/beta fold hydrolase [Dehalococcoidia bacterium]
MPVIKVNGIELYYEAHGEGEPLLLIMGYGSNSGHWFVILPRLAARFKVIIFDNRGAGRSGKPEIPYTADMMVGDAVGLLDALGIESAHVFGVSMGGMIAQEIALRHPSRVKKLVLGCTSCGGTHAIGSTPEAKSFLFNPERAKLSDEERARSTVPWLWNRDFIDKQPEAVERYVKTTTQYPTPTHGYMSQANFVLLHDTYERLPQIEIPALVMTGARDRLIPPQNSRILSSRIKGAELAVFEQAGHGFISDTADESSEKIIRFLES